MASMDDVVMYLTNKGGEATHAVVQIDVWHRLLEDMDDQALSDAAKRSADTLPEAVAERIIFGENPVKVYRIYRGFTQAELAEAVGIKAAYLSQIETGRRRPGRDLLPRLAEALGTDPDDLDTGAIEQA